MARYISEEEFIAWVKEHWCADCQNANGLRCRACWIDDAIDVVEEAPAADVVEVVRCKDCVYRMELHPMYAYEGRSCKVCFIRNKPVSDNGYCSDAIRKEDE